MPVAGKRCRYAVSPGILQPCPAWAGYGGAAAVALQLSNQAQVAGLARDTSGFQGILWNSPDSYDPTQRRRKAVTDPNVNATAETVSDKLDGTNTDGQILGYRKAAMFYDANMFGLSKDYAFPEGPNTSPSLLDQETSLAKLLTRKQTLADGNNYDL
jgi:hypothetical protein